MRPGDLVALSPSVDGMIVDVLRASADSGAFPTGSIRIVAGRRPDRSSGEVRVAQTVYLVNDHLLSGDELLGLPSDERVLLERRSTGVIIGWPDRVGGPGGPPEITLVRLEVRGEVGPLLLGGSG